MPRLTVGMPVYNGEEFLREALDSVLAQTYTDFELLIADNASEDSTPDIIAEYAAADARVRHVRHERNLGSAGNFNSVLAAADTELFKWVAGDDVHAPTYVERCIDVLDERPELVGAHSRTMRIDEDSRLIKPETYRLHTDGPAAHVRFRNVIAKPHSCFQSFAVFRTEMVQQTVGMQPFPGSDRVFLADVALRGPTAEVPEYLLFRRVHSGSHSAAPELDQSEKVHFWAGEREPADTDTDTDTGTGTGTGTDASTAEGEESGRRDEAAQDREGRADEPAVPLLYHEYLELTDTVPLDPRERRRCRLEVHLTHTAAQIRSEAMRWFVYPVRKRMNSRRAGRSGTTETTGATPPTPEAPLWTDYLEQAASDDRPFRGR